MVRHKKNHRFDSVKELELPEKDNHRYSKLNILTYPKHLQKENTKVSTEEYLCGAKNIIV